MKRECLDIVEEIDENMHDDILGNIQLEEEKDENLQTVKGEVHFTLPILNEVEGEREKFVEEIQTEESLQKIRVFADRGERGYFWDDGLLKQSKTDQTGLVTNRLVVPRGKRSRIMTLAHDKTGHLGHKKVLKMIQRVFVWPVMYRKVVDWCRSCARCQKVSKT